jgi:hypothetical protein
MYGLPEANPPTQIENSRYGGRRHARDRIWECATGRLDDALRRRT